MFRLACAATVLLMLVLVACATPEEPAAPPQGAAAPATTLGDLAWLAGSWVGQEAGADVEELWMQPRGDLMLGIHRDSFPTGEQVFEYLRIEHTPEGTRYLASPQGAEPTSFLLIESSATRAVFENEQDQDFPRRVLYWIEDDGLRIRIEGEQGGESSAVDWHLSRPAPPGPG